MFFCKLEPDEKTFIYFKKYMEETPTRDILKIYNEIQAEEIKTHCINNGIPENDINEQLEWVKKNADRFRVYINTIEIAQVIWLGSGKNWDDINYTDFCKLEDNINNMKKSGLLEKLVQSFKEEFFE